jgi:small subunit ribosomal protein S34
VRVLAERVFRGKQFEKPVWIERVSYKPDYRLLSKKEEAEYCKLVPQQEKILPTHMELPPLLKEFLIKETGREDHKMRIKHKPSMYKTSRLAKDGEKPNVEVTLGLGKPWSPKLFEGVQL